MTTVSFHFHGYQPGDVVRWIEPDPLKPPRFEERRSSVAVRIGDERVQGRNWTDAMLRSYGRIETVLERVPGVASVDVEPQTLAWLLEKDPDAYGRTIAAWRGGIAGLVITPPFHPILPHLHRMEREALFEIMIDFFAPILRDHEGPIGLWLPETAYSAEALTSYCDSARRVSGTYAGLPDLVGSPHLLVDARQLAASEESSTAWGRTGLDAGLRFAARDPRLSGDFAFGRADPSGFAASVASRHADSLLVASDLESLLANRAQAERFVGIVESLRTKGATVASPSPPARPMAAEVLDLSSWSDYDEHLFHGRTSDTRWTGMRRSDAAVVSRVHRGAPLSQLWKHAFFLVSEEIENAVRRTALRILKGLDIERRPAVLRRLAVAYARGLFRSHYRACRVSSSDLAFETAAGAVLRGRVDIEVAAYLARGYTTMLMGLRSDPRFWDNPDTRVTFQGVTCLAQALEDMAEACARAGESDRGARLRRLSRASLIEFSESYSRLGLSELRGAESWEGTEDAWIRSLQSEVAKRSEHDVFRRAALFAVGGEGERTGEGVADTGHIVGEAHGEWENPEWCEHRPA